MGPSPDLQYHSNSCSVMPCVCFASHLSMYTKGAVHTPHAHHPARRTGGGSTSPSLWRRRWSWLPPRSSGRTNYWTYTNVDLLCLPPTSAFSSSMASTRHTFQRLKQLPLCFLYIWILWRALLLPTGCSKEVWKKINYWEQPQSLRFLCQPDWRWLVKCHEVKRV